MHRALATLLPLLLAVVLGCPVPDETPYFDRGGERPPEAEQLPWWGTDSCGAPGAAGSPWSGLIPLDWQLEDQYGRAVRLHQFCGRVIVLRSLSLATENLESQLLELEALRADFNPWELAVVALVGEDGGAAPSSAELAELAEPLDLGFPLLADPGWEVTLRYLQEVPAESSNQLYAPGLVLEATGLSGVDESDVAALLPGGGTS